MYNASKFVQMIFAPLVLGVSLLASCATYETAVPIDRSPISGIVTPVTVPPARETPAGDPPTADTDGFGGVTESAPEQPELPRIAAAPEREPPAEAAVSPAMSPERPPEEEFSVDYPILGKGRQAPEQLAAFLVTENPQADREFAVELAGLYVEEAAAEGINHDVAFSQMCLETGFLRFGGLVSPDQNNFCGLGATGPGEPGLRFPNPRIGIRAQIQHLKGYATDGPLNQELVDPRYRYIRYGTAPTLQHLVGTWAVDRNYALKIVDILKRLYAEDRSPKIAENS